MDWKLKKGYTIFQWALIGLMGISVLLNSRETLLLCLGGFLIGFIEPKQKKVINKNGN